MQPMALIVFLRGVNVGGHRTFRPSLLGGQLSNFGVINIGAAGTFVTPKPISQTLLRSEFLKRLPFATHIMMCASRDLIAAVSQNPFTGETHRADTVRFVAVLSKRPRILPSIPLCIPSDGRWLVRILSRHDRFVFGYYRREMKVISYLGSIDKIFGVPATIRNWNTINQIIEVFEKSTGRGKLAPQQHKQPHFKEV